MPPSATIAPARGCSQVLGGLCFAAGAFTRGSFVAHAIALALALLLARDEASRSRRVLFAALVGGTALAVVQAVLHSWPYFFSAAANHLARSAAHPAPRSRSRLDDRRRGARCSSSISACAASPRRPAPWRGECLRIGAGLALALAAFVLVQRAWLGSSETGPDQQVLAVLLRHGGPLPLLLALAGVGLAVRRADAQRLPWVALAAAIVLTAALKSGVRYEFYYARYFVADVVPVLTVASACLLGHFIARAERRLGPRRAALAFAVLLLAWLLPPLRLLPARGLLDPAISPTTPRSWPAFLNMSPRTACSCSTTAPPAAGADSWPPRPCCRSAAMRSQVPPGGHIVEGALKAGTPVFLLLGRLGARRSPALALARPRPLAHPRRRPRHLPRPAGRDRRGRRSGAPGRRRRPVGAAAARRDRSGAAPAPSASTPTACTSPARPAGFVTEPLPLPPAPDELRMPAGGPRLCEITAALHADTGPPRARLAAARARSGRCCGPCPPRRPRPLPW